MQLHDNCLRLGAKLCLSVSTHVMSCLFLGFSVYPVSSVLPLSFCVAVAGEQLSKLVCTNKSKNELLLTIDGVTFDSVLFFSLTLHWPTNTKHFPVAL